MNKIYNLIIVGAGPAGLSAGLRAKDLSFDYLILEKEKICNFISENYISGKTVSVAPKNLELHGNLWFQECKVEELLKKWREIASVLNVKENEEVLNIEKRGDVFLLITKKAKYNAEKVIVAIGKESYPRKLNVEGENLKEKVFYRLKNPDEFKGKKILIVGGGDSAIDAALSLYRENYVTVSYRKEKFFRLNEENSKNIDEKMNSGKVKVIFNSNVKKITKNYVLLDISGKEEKIENDFVFIFAGNDLPIDFFRKIPGLKIEKEKVVLDENFQTTLTGLFVIGDAAGKPPFLIKPAINQGFDVVNFIYQKKV